MAIRIITDSASDILPAEAERMGITVLPMTILWDDVQYRDAVDMDHNEFFERLEGSSTLPTTSLVSPDVFLEKYEELTKNGDEVLVITISSVLSGTCQSATIAAEEYEGRVVVVDSLSATVGERILVQKGLEYIKEKRSLKEIADRLNEDRLHIRVLARLDTLEYLKRGGRISAATALAAGILSIKPVITIQDGAISLIGKARGSKNANNLLHRFVDEAGGIDFDNPFCLVYSGCSGVPLQQYIDDSRDLWVKYTNELPISTIGATVGTHIGPGAVGIAFFCYLV